VLVNRVHDPQPATVGGDCDAAASESSTTNGASSVAASMPGADTRSLSSVEEIVDSSSSSSGANSQAEMPAGLPGRAHADHVSLASDDDYDDEDVPEMGPLHGDDDGGTPELDQRQLYDSDSDSDEDPDPEPVPVRAPQVNGNNRADNQTNNKTSVIITGYNIRNGNNCGLERGCTAMKSMNADCGFLFETKKPAGVPVSRSYE
jgi:hypothetical protein